MADPVLRGEGVADSYLNDDQLVKEIVSDHNTRSMFTPTATDAEQRHDLSLADYQTWRAEQDARRAVLLDDEALHNAWQSDQSTKRTSYVQARIEYHERTFLALYPQFRGGKVRGPQHF